MLSSQNIENNKKEWKNKTSNADPGILFCVVFAQFFHSDSLYNSTGSC